MTQPISAIHTPCKSCVFAKFEDKTQTNCFLDYISIYKDNNIQVLEAYDNEKEFFIINDKKCIGYRESKWFDKRGMTNSSLDEKIAKYQEANYAHYLAVIDLKYLSLSQFNNICFSLSKCSIRPEKIVILRYAKDNKIFGYKNIESILKDTNIGCEWRIQTMLDDDIEYNYTLNDIIKNNLQCRFVLSINNYNDSFDNIINYANTKVYKKLQNFCACGNSDKTTILYSSTVFRHAFDVGKNILDDPSLYEII
jgi:hypothetical protein